MSIKTKTLTSAQIAKLRQYIVDRVEVILPDGIAGDARIDASFEVPEKIGLALFIGLPDVCEESKGHNWIAQDCYLHWEEKLSRYFLYFTWWAI